MYFLNQRQASKKKPLQTDLAVFVFVIFFCAFHSRCLYMSICILFLVRVTSRNRCAGLGQKTMVKPKLDKAQNLNWHMIADQVNKLLYFVLYLLAPTGALIVIVCYYWSARQLFSDFEHFCQYIWFFCVLKAD